jgi:hypothetical protein
MMRGAAQLIERQAPGIMKTQQFEAMAVLR